MRSVICVTSNKAPAALTAAKLGDYGIDAKFGERKLYGLPEDFEALVSSINQQRYVGNEIDVNLINVVNNINLALVNGEFTYV